MAEDKSGDGQALEALLKRADILLSLRKKGQKLSVCTLRCRLQELFYGFLLYVVVGGKVYRKNWGYLHLRHLSIYRQTPLMFKLSGV